MTEQAHWKLLACSTILLILLVVVAFGQGHPSAPVYDVKGIVTDVTRADIAEAIIVFASSYSEPAFIAQTGTNGSTHLRLRSGHYVVTVYIRGFKAIKVADFAVEASTPAVLKVVLDPAKVERTVGDGKAVPDSAAAIKTAEAVLGEKQTRSLRPFEASLYEDVWTVTRRCKSWCVGVNPTVMILKRDGQVIFNQSIYLK